ncbi:MAG: hypothetical protein N3F09_06910 [Bacteroidia bacterium]|nr:hypothetical protein [Bacteroidia bacterium]
MKKIRPCLIFIFFLFSGLTAQVSTIEDIVIEEDSITVPYKPSGNHVYFKSKKKSGGMEKIQELDNIIKNGYEINEIVLVYTEDSPADFANREADNRNRWENLMAAHPDIFQFNTNYRSVLQKANSSNAEAMKSIQGFYVYYSKTSPPSPPPLPPSPTSSKPSDPMTKGDVKKGTEPENQTFEIKENKKNKKEKETAEVPKENKKDKMNKEKDDVVKDEKKAEDAFPEPTPEPTRPKRTITIYSSPRKAKDPKACRPPCYEEGDEGLVNYFKSALTLSKRERKKFDEYVTIVKLTLDFNGAIKKMQVTCPDKDLQGRVENALNGMGNWLPAVKGGITVKSEVRFLLKYDKSSKAILPSDFQIIPRPNPKCNKCLSDSEIFAD